MLGLPTGTVSLSEYDPKWPEYFSVEKDRLVAALGELETEVAHVGSTSVPGMLAKPLIDVMIGLPTLANVTPAIPIMESLGYLYKGEFGIPDRHFFTLAEPTTHHVHMVFHGGPFWRLNLLFRDYLRANPEEARAYEQLKRDLVAKYPDQREMYTKGKDAFIRAMLARAGWNPQS